jgi:hypothetical protein
VKIPRYWAKETHEARDAQGRLRAFACWRWSDASVEEARREAKARAIEIARKFLSHERLDRYAYGERPLREEIIEVIRSRDREEVRVVTRNAYGALVLNAARAMFIDIDFPKEPVLKSLLTRVRKGFDRTLLSQEERHIQRIEGWARENSTWGMRVFRTFGGFRCLVTDRVFDPAGESTLDILRRLESDPLYIRLCQRQECFRARLTPKPWRCGIQNPPSRYPWETPGEESEYRRWEDRYQLAASRYTTCKLVREIGAGRIHPDVERILSLHDRLACLGANRLLA